MFSAALFCQILLATTALAIHRNGPNFVVDGTTLQPGAVASIDDETVSVLSNGAGLIVGSPSPVRAA